MRAHRSKSILIFVIIFFLVLLLGLGLYANRYLQGWFINPTRDAKQMILVIADDWTSTTGVLQRFTRKDVNAAWQKVGDKITVNLGKNGMGWGIGLHGSTLTFEPRVIEGAKKTPVGVFPITLAFGKDSVKKIGVKLPYTQITNTVFCPDDKSSQFYNSLVNTKTVTKDWNSAEDMHYYMQQGLYTYGLMVNHNYEKPIPGRGSCFFIHIQRGVGMPTAGCTAFAANLVRDVVVWVEPSQNPVLVQLPKNIYIKFKQRWSLPQI
jgi:L,D-peptidoglycan transpeptidase YkuD (ErfK/YbiS/YcfS/YnhG family)